jgi:hypothetical protein
MHNKFLPKAKPQKDNPQIYGSLNFDNKSLIMRKFINELDEKRI